ncbi:MAG: radical SAM family heme chaperone HemW [Defluviitaleaceae bacterium]|nr:radical SAM family heme chaperone HemW [Defluviitaleaceae bacterium]
MKTKPRNHGSPHEARGTEISGFGMGLYIHIPFCVSKCSYCDFLSFEGAKCQQQYVDALLAEMNTAHEIDTVYIGGGTPTALPTPLLCKVLKKIQTFNIIRDIEVTVEMNPITNAHSLLPELKAHGVNRLSIGLQAWQDDLLAKVKRAHTSRDFTETIQAAHAAGIDNINVDLMFGLPGQTMEDWLESIAQVISHAPQHISAYSLTPAENTHLWNTLKSGEIIIPDDETDRAMYHEVIRQLAASGYRHYELSNFAKPGFEGRHNANCWTRRPYLGFGLGAHSFDGSVRWHNTEDMKLYLEGSIQEGFQHLSTQDAMSEFMFLGLRMTDGINPHDFQSQFGTNLSDCYGSIINELIVKGLLEYKDGKLALTSLGLDLANQVFESFI